jgi:pumilio family protein 6
LRLRLASNDPCRHKKVGVNLPTTAKNPTFHTLSSQEPMARAEKRPNGLAANDSRSDVKKRKLTSRPAAKVPATPKNQSSRQNVNKANGKKADSESDFDGFTSDDADQPTAAAKPAEPPKHPDQANKSRESHQKQKALAASRKAAKSHADEIAAAKKLWERLRRKSHVAKDERQKLVAELFAIVTGQVKDFVFKHDSVRVVQCAVKYATVAQRREIARELQGEFRALAESRYAKFLLAKLITDGDGETRALIIPEFYGHVRRLMSHPEASWIVDDIYRTVATREQKARLLREWYGPEFAIFKGDKAVTADLSKILEENPEKRVALLRYLYERINQLIQKKSTGFTMLHDAMLQYFLQLSPESEDFTQFLSLVIGDNKEEEVDLLRNLAFTKSGSEIVCMTIAHSKAKERRLIIKAFKDVIEMLAYDKYGHRVLIAALEVFDDTREMKDRVYSELIKLTKTATEEAQTEQILNLATHHTGHLCLLYPMIGAEKQLPGLEDNIRIMQKVKTVRETTSKKDPAVRRAELISAISAPLLQAIQSKADQLVSSTGYAHQLITETLFKCDGDKSAALSAIAAAVSADPAEPEHPAHKPPACKLLKTLVAGGRFDRKAGKVVPVDPPLHFADTLWEAIRGHADAWVTGDGGFVVLALLEAPWKSADGRADCRDRVVANRAALEAAIGKAEGGSAEEMKRGKCAEFLLEAVR